MSKLTKSMHGYSFVNRENRMTCRCQSLDGMLKYVVPGEITEEEMAKALQSLQQYHHSVAHFGDIKGLFLFSECSDEGGIRL